MAGGPPHPTSPEHDSSNSLSTQGKIKTDGASAVSLMNEDRLGGQPEGDVFPQPGYEWPHPRDPCKRESRGNQVSWPNPPCCPGNSTDSGGKWEDREGLPDREEGNLNKTLTSITIFMGTANGR